MDHHSGQLLILAIEQIGGDGLRDVLEKHEHQSKEQDRHQECRPRQDPEEGSRPTTTTDGGGTSGDQRRTDAGESKRVGNRLAPSDRHPSRGRRGFCGEHDQRGQQQQERSKHHGQGTKDNQTYRHVGELNGRRGSDPRRVHSLEFPAIGTDRLNAEIHARR